MNWILSLLKRIGRMLGYNTARKMLCPFHKENTPSMLIWDDENRYKCFGCGKTGKLNELNLE